MQTPGHRPPKPQNPLKKKIGCFGGFTTIFRYLGSRRIDPSRNFPVNSILAPVLSGNRFSGNREIGVLETCGPEPLRTMAPKDESIRIDPNIFVPRQLSSRDPGIPGSQDPGILGSWDPGILHPALGTSMHISRRGSRSGVLLIFLIDCLPIWAGVGSISADLG